MAQNKLVIPRKRDILLHDTRVENLFINELLPLAPGDYVKVYLFALMHAEFACELDKETMSRVLGLSEETIASAWAYWEDKGAIAREYDPENKDYTIIFISQLESMYGAGPYTPQRSEEPSGSYQAKEPVSEPADIPDESSDNIDTNEISYIDDEEARIAELELRALYTEYEETRGKTISSREAERIREAINDFGVTPDVFTYAIKYSAEKDIYDINYISKVAIKWTEEGCKDISQVKEVLDRHSKRMFEYNSIFKQMGFRRQPNPGDIDMMSRWLDDMGFNLNEVLDACRKTAGKREPTLNYVNAILENQLKEKQGTQVDSTGKAKTAGKDNGTVSKKVLFEYYEYLRNVSAIELQEHINEVKNVDEIADVMEEERSFNSKMISVQLGSKGRKSTDQIIAMRKSLDEKMAMVLMRNGYPANYLTESHKCSVCKDYGVLENGKYCSCAKDRAAEAYKWNQRRKGNLE